jgi:hypothetical protein
MQVETHTGLHEYERTLKEIYSYWNEKGRPENFDAHDYTTSSDASFFVYTNVITNANRVFHSRLGAHLQQWQSGTLILTDEGIFLWVRTRDGRVEVSPELTNFKDEIF